MADKGIIFSAPMVRALLDGRKTQTRRLVRPVMLDGVNPNFSQMTAHRYGGQGRWMLHGSEEASLPFKVPYAPGDRLYVREAFSYDTLDVDRDGTLPPWYWADGNLADAEQGSGNFTKPKPSIHMPRWASRLTLLVTDVRVQRVAEIDYDDCIAEGIEQRWTCLNPLTGSYARGNDVEDDFRGLWNSLHTKLGETWEANPWVCAITFAVKRGNIDSIPEEA